MVFGTAACGDNAASSGDAASSALITYPAEKDFKYVVMPMRI